ncbi:hypothetical protein IHE55_12225 [Streptomyces pactum]|uniref:Uncharacterized protein n=1 Tax=Streptomyces pactum TaxID=68249 RepID=A0ABS0NK34_9ACTN|nr:hypothetical protein [Streptomyces pactum]MBH5335523.1 hypothetical protein [Streptomyces pactum]
MCTKTTTGPRAGTERETAPDRAAGPGERWPGPWEEPATEADHFASLLGVYVRSLTMVRGMDQGHAGGCG